MNKEVTNLVEQRLAEYERHRSSVLESWSGTINKAEEFYKAETGKTWSEWMKKNLSLMLENTALDARQRGMTKLVETTTGDAVSYLGVEELCAA
jgi:hypothetical protein